MILHSGVMRAFLLRAGTLWEPGLWSELGGTSGPEVTWPTWERTELSVRWGSLERYWPNNLDDWEPSRAVLVLFNFFKCFYLFYTWQQLCRRRFFRFILSSTSCKGLSFIFKTALCFLTFQPRNLVLIPSSSYNVRLKSVCLSFCHSPGEPIEAAEGKELLLVSSGRRNLSLASWHSLSCVPCCSSPGILDPQRTSRRSPATRCGSSDRSVRCS